MAVIDVAWQSRDEPLEPSAVLVHGSASRRLAEHLLEADDERFVGLRGVSATGLIVLLGEASALPWIEGVEYLGRDARAPSLLVPTTRMPSVPLPLFERAVLSRTGRAAPIAVTREFVASVAAARPLARSQLARWIEREVKSR
jgi:hypothetical protein